MSQRFGKSVYTLVPRYSCKKMIRFSGYEILLVLKYNNRHRATGC